MNLASTFVFGIDAEGQPYAAHNGHPISLDEAQRQLDRVVAIRRDQDGVALLRNLGLTPFFLRSRTWADEVDGDGA